METAAQMVWCVVCLDDSGEVVHIFSSPEKANEFCEKDPRPTCHLRLRDRLS
jgi:hypothetical protein